MFGYQNNLLKMLVDIEQKNILVDLIKNRYDYDFSDYSESSLLRRINKFCHTANVKSFFDLKHHIVNDVMLFERFINEITVNVTEMFREPFFFKVLAKEIFPYMDTYPSINIWHAGCSTGEEVYSNVILLEENGLYNKSTVFATDINSSVLEKARQGAYSTSLMKEYSKSYLKAGGKNSLSDYYEVKYNQANLKPFLKMNTTFSSHNLVSDSSFKEFNLIVCRNVIIYFNIHLQERVFKLFYDSLPIFGYLALGSKETLQFSSFKDKFELISSSEKIYRKIA
jgi:chemotaxis protein methyltransferase CheR